MIWLDTLKGKKLKPEVYEQLIDLFEKLDQTSTGFPDMKTCLHVMATELPSFKVPPTDQLDQIYERWKKLRIDNTMPLLRIFHQKPDAND